MIAVRARQAAHYNTEESFTFYVDPAGGSDSNAGTKALPYASLQKALTVATAGQSVGLKAGTTNRVTAVITSIAAGVRVGCYGCLPSAANMPIVSGGALVTGWNQQTSAPADQEVAAKGAGTTASAGTTGTTAQATEVVIAALATANTTGTITKPAAYTQRVNTINASFGSIAIADELVGSTGTFTDSWTITSAAWNDMIQTFKASSPAFLGVLNAGTGHGGSGGANALSASASIGNTVIVAAHVFSNQTVTGVTDTQGNTWTVVNGAAAGGVTVALAYSILTHALTTSDTIAVATPGGNHVDAIVAYSGITAPGTNTYAAAFSPTNAPAFVTFTTGGVTTGLTKGASATTLTTNQWFYTAGTLYVNLGGTDPSTVTVEAAVWRIIGDSTAGHDNLQFRGVSFRNAWDQAVALYNTHGHIFDRCDWRYVGYVSDSGSVALSNYTNAALPALFARITRCSFSFLMNDGGWSHAIPNLQVDYNTGSNVGYLVGDVQSDAWQTEDVATDGFTFHSSAGLWIHHNNFDMTGTQSPKGCILYNGFGTNVDGGLIERNVCKGANYGVANTAANTTIRYNTLANQVSSFGGGLHHQNNTAIDSVFIYGNVIYGSNRAALIAQLGTNALTNWYVVNNTFVDCAQFVVSFQAPVGVVLKNNIVWNTGTPGFPILQAFPNGGTEGTIAWDNNVVVDSASANAFRGAASGSSSYVNYTGFAAWKAGTGFDAHSLASDPLFTNPGSQDYSLQSGSPAKGTGVAVTIPAGATIWGRQIPAVVIPAGGNIGAL